jgi:hypothetical protein
MVKNYMFIAYTQQDAMLRNNYTTSRLFPSVQIPIMTLVMPYL